MTKECVEEGDTYTFGGETFTWSIEYCTHTNNNPRKTTIVHDYEYSASLDTQHHDWEGTSEGHSVTHYDKDGISQDGWYDDDYEHDFPGTTFDYKASYDGAFHHDQVFPG